MAIPRISRFVYSATDWTTFLPVRAWTPVDETVGGRRISAAGVPATYIVRRDVLVEVTLRFWEVEWPDVLDLVTFGQSGESFAWFPDAAEPENYAVYLESPAPGERFAPTRDGSFPRVFEATLVLRGVDSVLPFTQYYES